MIRTWRAHGWGTCLPFRQQLHSAGSYKDFRPRDKAGGVAFDRDPRPRNQNDIHQPIVNFVTLPDPPGCRRNPGGRQGQERRMTATGAIVPGRVAAALVRTGRSGRIGRNRRTFLVAANVSRQRANSVITIFCRAVTIFLDKRRAQFHYSVIGRFAAEFQAFGCVGGRCPNDEVSALNFRFAAPAADAGFFPHSSRRRRLRTVLHPRSILASNRWKKVLCR
jgi:hypothetical protein